MYYFDTLKKVSKQHGWPAASLSASFAGCNQLSQGRSCRLSLHSHKEACLVVAHEEHAEGQQRRHSMITDECMCMCTAHVTSVLLTQLEEKVVVVSV
jgi:hypothetical protein